MPNLWGYLATCQVKYPLKLRSGLNGIKHKLNSTLSIYIKYFPKFKKFLKYPKWLLSWLNVASTEFVKIQQLNNWIWNLSIHFEQTWNFLHIHNSLPLSTHKLLGKKKKYVLYFKAKLYLHYFIHSYRSCILIQISILISSPQANAFNCSAFAECSVTYSIPGIRFLRIYNHYSVSRSSIAPSLEQT